MYKTYKTVPKLLLLQPCLPLVWPSQTHVGHSAQPRTCRFFCGAGGGAFRTSTHAPESKNPTSPLTDLAVLLATSNSFRIQGIKIYKDHNCLGVD